MLSGRVPAGPSDLTRCLFIQPVFIVRAVTTPAAAARMVTFNINGFSCEEMRGRGPRWKLEQWERFTVLFSGGCQVENNEAPGPCSLHLRQVSARQNRDIWKHY